MLSNQWLIRRGDNDSEKGLLNKFSGLLQDKTWLSLGKYFERLMKGSLWYYTDCQVTSWKAVTQQKFTSQTSTFSIKNKNNDLRSSFFPFLIMILKFHIETSHATSFTLKQLRKHSFSVFPLLLALGTLFTHTVCFH